MIRKMHETTKWGADGHIHADKVSFFAGMIDAKTILDYGCGRGKLKQKLGSRFTFSEYDPGIKGKESLPAPADLVVCTDVLEHVEIGNIGFVLKHINELAVKGAYLVISCRPANSILPDGRNAHLIIKDPDWWMIKIQDHFPKCQHKFIGKPKELKAWITR